MPPQAKTEKTLQKTTSSKERLEEEDEEEVEEIELPSQRSIYDKIYELAEKFAATRLGQFATEKGDRLLKIIEDTAKWSLPPGKRETKLERPLPWLPFLSLIIILRLLRVWLSVGALLIGNAPVSAHDLVYFVQTRRRKLRAVRVHGAKVIRRRERDIMSCRAANSNDKGLMGKFRKLLSRAICRPGQHFETERRVFIHKNQLNLDSTNNDRQASKRPRDDSCNDHNLTIDQMLSKYANEDSEDDSDFIPNLEEDTNDDSCTSSSSSAYQDEINDENPSAEENESVLIKDNKMKNLPQPICDIKEEPNSESDDSPAPKQKTQSKNINSNGLDKKTNEAAHKQTAGPGASSAATNHQTRNNQMANGHEEKHKSPSSSEPSNATNKSLPSNPVTMAGSPMDFEKSFQQQFQQQHQLQQHHLQQQSNQTTSSSIYMNSHSTPKNNEETTEEVQSKNKANSAANNQRQNYYPNNHNRFRGKNHRRNF